MASPRRKRHVCGEVGVGDMCVSYKAWGDSRLGLLRRFLPPLPSSSGDSGLGCWAHARLLSPSSSHTWTHMLLSLYIQLLRWAASVRDRPFSALTPPFIPEARIREKGGRGVLAALAAGRFVMAQNLCMMPHVVVGTGEEGVMGGPLISAASRSRLSHREGGTDTISHVPCLG